MPTPDNSEEPKIYIAKTSEQIEEMDGQFSVNAYSDSNEGFAVANNEKGGNEDLSAGMSQLNSQVNSSEESTQNEPAGIEETASGDTSSTEDVAKDELQGGDPSGDAGMGMGNDGSKPDEEEVDDSDIDAVESASDNMGETTETSQAKSLLQGIVDQTHVEEGRTTTNDDGDISKVRDVGSGDATDTGSESESNSSTTNAQNPTGASEETKEKSATETQFENILTNNNEAKVSAENEAADNAEYNNGVSEGLKVGRCAGFGKVIEQNQGNTKIKTFKEAGFESKEAFISKKHSETTAGKSTKFTGGYYSGYSNGYSEGQRLKVALAREKRARLEQNPNYLEGKRIGLEAGTKSVSKKAEDKTRATELVATADSWIGDNNLPEDADPSPEALKKQGFYAGYNKGRVDAKKAEIDAKKAEAAALLNNPEYRSGYDFGYNLGMNGMSSAQSQERDELMNRKDAQGQLTLAAKGVSAGYNKGHSDKVKADNALKAKKEKELGNDNHFLMGTTIGSLSAALKLENYTDEKSIATKIMEGESMSKFLNNPISINADVFALFQQQKLHLKMNNEQKAKYDRGFYNAYNKGTVQFKQNIQKQQDAIVTGSDAYKRGKSLGEVAGSAASVRDELKRNIATKKAERLKKNPNNEVPSTEEKALIDKEKKVSDNIKKIMDAVEIETDAAYKRGFYENYNKSYSKENSGREKAKNSLRNNEGGSSASSQNNSLYQQGLNIGRKMGELVFNLRKNSQEGLNERINKALEEAKAKGPDFESGYLQGYNEKVMGNKKKAKPKLANDKTLRDNAFDTVESTGVPNVKKIFDKASKELEKEWFEYAKKPENKRGKSPDVEHKKISKDNKTKTSFSKSYFSLDEKIKEEKDVLKYWEVYKAAYNLGKNIGSELGANFLEGYKDAIGGAETQKSPTKPYYSQGFNAGKKESGFKDLKDAVLSASGLGSAESMDNKNLSAQGEAYQLAYNTHFNNWHKIFLIKNGIQVPENLKESNLNILNELKEEEDNDSGEDTEAGDFQIANMQLENRDKIMNGMLDNKIKLMENEFENQAVLFVNEQYGNSLDSEEKSAFVARKLDIIKKEFSDKYKEGYRSAILKAESKVKNVVSDDLMHSKGYIVGYASANATFPAGFPDANMLTLIEAAKKGEEPESLKNSSAYQNGKTEGYQIGLQVNQGLKNPDEILGATESAETKNIRRKGKEAGKVVANDYKKNMLSADEVAYEIKPVEKTDDYKNISSENINIYIEAYYKEIELAKSYVEGYKSASNVIFNKNANDDYDFVESKVPDEELKLAFQKGYLEGRSNSLIDKRAGNDNSQTLLRNVAMNNKLANMEQLMGSAYTEIYKIGWGKGQSKGRSIDSAQLISLSSSISENGAEDMSNEVWKVLNKAISAFVNSSIKKAKSRGQDGSESKNKYAKLSLLNEKVEALKVKETKQNENVEIIKALIEDAFDGVGNALEDDKAEYKVLKTDGRKLLKELPAAYNDGYKEALESGMRMGKREKELKGPTKADSFYNTMLAAIKNKTEPFYVFGYSDAEKMLRNMNRKGQQATEEQMRNSVHRLPEFLRKRMHEAIEHEYKEFSKTAPDRSKTELYEKYKDNRNNYRNILSGFNDKLSASFEGKNTEEFIKVQVDVIKKELRELTADMGPDSRSFFIERIDGEWSKIIKFYKKGFETSHPISLKNINDKKSGTESASAGLGNHLDSLHSIIEDGSIEDSDISDIDLLDNQEEFMDMVYSLRAQTDDIEINLYEIEDDISDIKRDINAVKVKNRDLDFEIKNSSDDAKADELFELLQDNESYINDREFDVFDREADLKIVDEQIGVVAQELMNFSREELKFDAPQNTLSQFKSYIRAEDSRLNVVGTYNDASGNSRAEGSGTLTIIDNEERMKLQGNISLDLGEIEISSSEIELFNLENYVKLGAGELTIERNNTSIPFGKLDLEMGLGVLEQMNQQLNLGDQLKKGNLLSEDSLGGGLA